MQVSSAASCPAPTASSAATDEAIRRGAIRREGLCVLMLQAPLRLTNVRNPED
jgi:hypothetical protein